MARLAPSSAQRRGSSRTSCRAVAGPGKRELERTVDVRRRNELHPLERLDAALRLLGLGGLGAEAIDNDADAQLALLLDVRRLLQRQLLGARTPNCT